jgi:hypothetical protein
MLSNCNRYFIRGVDITSPMLFRGFHLSARYRYISHCFFQFNLKQNLLIVTLNTNNSNKTIAYTLEIKTHNYLIPYINPFAL